MKKGILIVLMMIMGALCFADTMYVTDKISWGLQEDFKTVAAGKIKGIYPLSGDNYIMEVDDEKFVIYKGLIFYDLEDTYKNNIQHVKYWKIAITEVHPNYFVYTKILIKEEDNKL